MGKGPAGTRKIELDNVEDARGAIGSTKYITARHVASVEKKC